MNSNLSGKKWVCLSAITTIFLIGACSDKKPESKGPPPALVEVAPVISGQEEDSSTLTGFIRAEKESLVSSEIEGRVVSFPRKEGDSIKQGQQVVKIDDTEFRLRLKEADGRLKKGEADYARLKSSYNRAKRLYNRKVLSEEELQNSQLTFEAAAADLVLRKAERSRAAYNVDRCSVKAPFDGLLASRHVEPGEWVDVGANLFELVDLSRVEARVEIPERNVYKVEVGAKSSVSVDGLPGRSFTGKVIAISPKADPRSRTFLLRIGIENKDGLIKSGMAARVSVKLGADSVISLIPRDAIVWRGTTPIVFTVDDKGSVSSIKISIGVQKGELVGAVSVGKIPLSEGMKLVVTGNETLRDGSVVTVTGVKRYRLTE